MGLDINLIREDKGFNIQIYNIKAEILTLLEVLCLRGLSKQRQWTILLKWIYNGERVININHINSSFHCGLVKQRIWNRKQGSR